MAGALSKIKKVGQAAEKAAEKTKGLGERAAEAALKTEKTARDRAMIEAAKAAKQGFLEPSVEKDVLYHGTRSDISKFIPGKRGAVFLTRDIDFANDYAPTSQMLFLNELPNSPNVMPVYAQVRNPFDYENPEHIDMVLNRANLPKAVDPQKIRDNLELGNWNYIEDKNIQKAIKDLGFDAFYIKEQGLKNIGVFDPKRIKSAIGMQGSYDITDPDITKAEGGAVTPDVVGGGTGIPLKKGGKVDHKLKEWYAAQGGFTDSYEQGLESQEKKSSDIEAYKQGKVGADALLRYFPGLSAAMVEEQLNPQMAKGGEVKMQGGGDPTAQIQQQLSQGVPVQMVPGKYGDIARQLIQIEEAARKKQEEERKARVEALPLADRLGGRLEAAKTIGSAVGKSMVAPYVALAKGEEYAKQFSEDIPIPKTEAGAYYTGTAAEMLETPAKFLEAAKIPDTPLTELVPTQYLPGLGRQLSGIAGKAMRSIDQAIPESLKNLPVGASIELVGEAPGKKKAPADRTGLYSPMEKAALNLERKEGTGMAFLNDLKKAGVTDEELEFSNVKRNLMDNADRKISRDTVAAWASQSRQPFNVHNIKEGQSIDDFNFTAREVIDDDDYINSRAAEIKIDFDDIYPGQREVLKQRLIDEKFKGDDLNDPLIQRRLEEDLDELIKEAAHEDARIEYYENPRWTVNNSFGYQILGNEDSGFTILRPDGSMVPQQREVFNLERAESMAREDAIDQGVISPRGVVYGKYQLGNGTNYQEFIIDAPQNNRLKYESPHWDSEEYEDVLLHTRTQDRTTTDGKPMLYVDEMQSDWHQEGRDKGYRDKEVQAKMDELDKLRRQKNDEAAELANDAYNFRRAKVPEIEAQLRAQYPVWPADKSLAIELNKALDDLPELKEAQAKIAQLKAEATALSDEKAKYFSRVPDAPFKDKWHEIGVKQMLHYAAKNGYDRVGFSSANPHIERWGTDQFAWERAPKLENNLSNYEKWLEKRFGDRGDPVPSEGFVKATYGYDGDPVYKEFVKDTQKPPGWRIASTEQRGGRAGDIDLEVEARARGILQKVDGERVSSKEELANVVESTIRNANPAKVERLTNKIWKMMQTQEAGVYEPRAEGMKFFYDQELRKFLEKYAKKIGATFYETETKTGRVVTPEGPKDKTEKVYMIEFTPDAKRSAELGQPFKKGGLVKVDQELREWGRKMASGGIPGKLAKAAGKAADSANKRMESLIEAERALPLRLARAPAKSKKEISSHAERVGRQMLGEHVTSNKQGDTKNLAGRSMKENERVKNLQYELEPIKDIPQSEVFQSSVGDINVAFPGDYTLSDVILKSIEGKPIGAVQQGGSRYGLGKLDLPDPLFWASGERPAQLAQDKITDIANLFETDRVFAEHLAMGPVATNFAQHFAAANLLSVDLNKMSKKDIKTFNNIISSGYQRKNPKSGKIETINFPEWPGIENPEAAYEAMKADPEMRKWFNDRMKTPSVTQSTNMPNGLDVQWAITHPELRNMEVNLTGHSLGRMIPGAELTDTAAHDTYNKGIQGKYLGHREIPAPFVLTFPDAAQHIASTKRPQDFTGTIQKVFPHQIVDNQYIDELGEFYRQLQKVLTGKKVGGLVNAESKKRQGGLAHVRK